MIDDAKCTLYVEAEERQGGLTAGGWRMADGISNRDWMVVKCWMAMEDLVGRIGRLASSSLAGMGVGGCWRLLEAVGDDAVWRT